MPVPRPFALVRTRDQWSRAVHDRTQIDAASEGVELRFGPEPKPPPRVPAVEPAGLAFDAECRLYHSVPAEGRVERARWIGSDAAPTTGAEPVELFADLPGPAGDFATTGEAPGPLLSPGALAVDVDDHLFVAEAGARRVLVYDLWNRRLVRRVSFATAEHPDAAPVDLACRGRVVWALLTGNALVRLGARSGPVPVELRRPPEVPATAEARRLAVSPDGTLFVLFAEGGSGWVVDQSGRRGPREVRRASDVDFMDEDGRVWLVVARSAGEDFLRFEVEEDDLVDDEALKGRSYDGAGIVRTPDGRIGFWTALGFRVAVVARARYVKQGRVTTYRLDSGEYHTEWGRLFLDACIPRDTDVRVFCATADDVSDEPTLAPSPPPNATINRPDLTPPLLPLALEPADDDDGFPLHRRETGRELPWARMDESDPFETYEAPVIAPPGRYLWVTLELRGTGRFTPRVRSLRAEHPSHDLLRRLPKAFSRDEAVASFLRRYLAVVDGALGDLEARAEWRFVLLDAAATPAEALPWLASFLGLVLDESWPEPAKRQLIAEIPKLWRFRGTLWGLGRFLHLYLGREPIIVEHYRLRGLGGALLSDERSSLFAGAVVGETFRVGGAVGEAGVQPLSGSAASAFEAHAHRFSVVIPALLDADGTAAVRHVLEEHRPAHTVVDVCTVRTGMRVGIGLHVGLLSVIGRSGGFTPLQLGSSLLARGTIVGRPEAGERIGIGRIGRLRLG